MYTRKGKMKVFLAVIFLTSLALTGCGRDNTKEVLKVVEVDKPVVVEVPQNDLILEHYSASYRDHTANKIYPAMVDVVENEAGKIVITLKLYQTSTPKVYTITEL